MMKIVKFFKYSPVPSSILEENLKELGIDQLKHILFVKTRWNSLVISTKRFIVILPGIQKTLIDVGSDLDWENHDTSVLKVKF